MGIFDSLKKIKNPYILQALVCLLMVHGGIIALSSFTFILAWKNESIPIQGFQTSIPWISKEQDCIHTRREWRNNKCWDSEHSTMF